MKYTALILLLSFAAALEFQIKSYKTSTNIVDLKSLPIPQKLAIYAASKLTLKPASYEVKWADLFSPDDNPGVDIFYVDVRTLLIQSIKVPEEPGFFPELDWTFSWGGCFIGWCFNETWSLVSEDTILRGQKNIESINEITATTFKNTFRSPSFVLHSPKFLYNITDYLDDDKQYLYRDFNFTINNISIVTSLNYEYVPDLGVQVRNLSIEFEYGYMAAHFANVTIIRGDGSVENREPITNDYTFYLEMWEDEFKETFIPSFEFRINCLLSDSRNDPARCEPEEEEPYLSKDAYKMNLLQLIETIGLASLDRGN